MTKHNDGGAHNLMTTWEKQRILAIDACMEENTPYSNAKGNEIMLQEKGGPCPFCGVPLEQREGKNFDGTPFVYWMPACRCYHTCRICGRVMIAERFMDPPQVWCGNCEFERIEKKPRKKKLSDRARDGKMAAAADISEKVG